MRILLINPWICDVAAYDFWLKPLGILYVGAILERWGVEVELLDLMDRHSPFYVSFLENSGLRIRQGRYGSGKFYHEELFPPPPQLQGIPRRFKRYGWPRKIAEERVRKIIRRFDAVFITSCMTYWYWGIVETVKLIKEICSLPIFLGGIYVNLVEWHARSLGKEHGFEVVKGVGVAPVIEAMRKLTGYEYSDDFDWFEDLHPAYHLYNHSLPYGVLMTSVGCPMRCTYCITPRLWGGLKSKKAKKVIYEVDMLIDMGAENIVFFDDAFLLNPDVDEVLDLLAKYAGKVRFLLPNGVHARLLTMELACKLKRANFVLIYLGYESSGSLQYKTGGKVTDEDLKKAVHNLKKAGYGPEEIKVYIMVNMPGQRKEDVEKAIEFCESLDVDYSLNEYTPIPGTLDWVELIKEKKLDPDVDPLLLNNSVLPYWWKHGMDVETIEKLKRLKNRRLG